MDSIMVATPPLTPCQFTKVQPAAEKFCDPDRNTRTSSIWTSPVICTLSEIREKPPNWLALKKTSVVMRLASGRVSKTMLVTLSGSLTMR